MNPAKFSNGMVQIPILKTRKRAEDALVSHEQNFRLLVDTHSRVRCHDDASRRNRTPKPPSTRVSRQDSGETRQLADQRRGAPVDPVDSDGRTL